MILGANLRNIVFEPKKGSSLFLSLFIRDSKNKTLDQQKLLVVFQILVLRTSKCYYTRKETQT